MLISATPKGIPSPSPSPISIILLFWSAEVGLFVEQGLEVNVVPTPALARGDDEMLKKFVLVIVVLSPGG